MIYVYDMVMNKQRVESFKRYGIRYKFERKFLMGDREFYSFVAPGVEKILVVPGFAEMYRDAEAMLNNRFSGEHTYEESLKWIRKTFGDYIDVEDFPTEKSANGIMKQINVDYKDIRIAFQYMNNTLAISPEFEIRDHNIFGNGIVVLMNVNMED